jgi:hypothetical protein
MSKLPPVAQDMNNLINKMVKMPKQEEREDEMFFSIVLGCLMITTENIQSAVVLNEIATYELVDTDDGGIASFTLKGNHQELVYHCKNKASWKQVLKWFDDYQMEIIEGMTQSVKKEKKKARF